MRTSSYSLVRKFFEVHPIAPYRPGHVTRWVEEQKGLHPGDQSAGAVRAGISKLLDEGYLRRHGTTPLEYIRTGGTPPEPVKPAPVGALTKKDQE